MFDSIWCVYTGKGHAWKRKQKVYLSIRMKENFSMYVSICLFSSPTSELDLNEKMFRKGTKKKRKTVVRYKVMDLIC